MDSKKTNIDKRYKGYEAFLEWARITEEEEEERSGGEEEDELNHQQKWIIKYCMKNNWEYIRMK